MCPAMGSGSVSSGSSRCCSSSSSSSACLAGGGEDTGEVDGTGRATATRSPGSTAGTSRRTARRRPKLVISRSRTSPVYKEHGVGRDRYPLPALPPAGGDSDLQRGREMLRLHSPTMALVKLILLVDDEPQLVQLVRDYLEHGGFGVVTASDGPTALRAASTQHPDLIVLDLGLPGLDGLDVMRTLRKTGEVPIIVLTARGEESDKVAGLELGA